MGLSLKKFVGTSCATESHYTKIKRYKNKFLLFSMKRKEEGQAQGERRGGGQGGKGTQIKKRKKKY